MKSLGLFTITLFLAVVASAADAPTIIFASSETPQLIVTGPENVDPESLAKAIQSAKDAVSPELVNVLADAASNQELWDKAIRNPDGFLRDRGFLLKDLNVRLYERAHTGEYVTNPCPDGLVAVRVDHWVQTCLRWVELVKCTQLSDGVVCVHIWVCVGSRMELVTTTECGLPVTVFH